MVSNHKQLCEHSSVRSCTDDCSVTICHKGEYEGGALQKDYIQ